jgi:hypothetical protein
MIRLSTNMAMIAAVTLTVTTGAANARGGGHGGSVARPMTASPGVTTSPRIPMTLSPGFGLSGGHGGAGLPAVLPRQSALSGGMRSLSAGAARQPATVGRPQIMQAPGAAPRNIGSAAAASLFLNSGIGIIPTPLPPPPAPPAEIAAPAPELAPIAPLSPQLQTQFSTGGVVQPSMALSPGSSSESAPSTPGGGGESLADCMGFWDRETHMNKAEWKSACTRTMEDYPNISRPG